MVINYITKNKAKVESARQFFNIHGIEINQIKMDTIEIQSDSIEDVAKFSARYAYEKLKKPVLKNDTGFFVEALNGFPGAYVHYIEDKIGYDGFLKLLDGKENRNAYFLEVFALAFSKDEIYTFTCKTSGKISTEPMGSFGWGLDYVFIPSGEEKPLACFEDSERYKKWNNDGFNKILKLLSEK